MSKIDWSLAPEDATHYGSGEDCGYWAKCIGNQQYFINIARWDNGKWKEVSERYDEKFLTARPRKEWSGPEDGLPPVGVLVEVFECTHDYTKRFNGQKVRILCHENDVAVFAAKNFEYHALVKEKFRPIRTPEELAAQLRESAIRELMDIAQVDCRVTAARLVDAGFKRDHMKF